MSDKEKVLLRVEEAAEHLGLSRATTYTLVMSGEIPSLKIGRSRRVPQAALETYVARLLEEQGAER